MQEDDSGEAERNDYDEFVRRERKSDGVLTLTMFLYILSLAVIMGCFYYFAFYLKNAAIIQPLIWLQVFCTFMVALMYWHYVP